jgi:hypothetical protein
MVELGFGVDVVSGDAPELLAAAADTNPLPAEAGGAFFEVVVFVWVDAHVWFQRVGSAVRRR